MWREAICPVTDAESCAKAVEALFGASTRDSIIKMYPPSPDATRMKMTTDAFCTCQSDKVARAIVSSGGGPVYRYFFDYVRENSNNSIAVHSAEIRFLFPWKSEIPTTRDVAVRDVMTAMWTQMATRGFPTITGYPEWTPHTASTEAYLHIGSSVLTTTGPADAQCRFWATLPLPWPHL